MSNEDVNLPVIHERVSIVDKARCDFSIRLYEEEVLAKDETTLDKSIEAFSQAILNLNRKDSGKVNVNEYQKIIERVLDEVNSKYGLTYGENVSILASNIQKDSKYVIRFERHGDLKKEGGLA